MPGSIVIRTKPRSIREPDGSQTVGTMIESHPDLGLHGAERYAETRGDRRMSQAFNPAETESLGAPKRQLAQCRIEHLQLTTRLREPLRTWCFVGNRQEVIYLDGREDARSAQLRTFVVHDEVGGDPKQEGALVVEACLAVFRMRDPEERLVRQIRRIVLADLPS